MKLKITKKNSTIVYCGLLILFFLIITPSFANNASETIFTESMRQYLLKNYQAAAKDLKKIYSINKHDPKYKKWYYLALVKAGDAEYEKGDYEMAKQYYLTAISLNKQNIQIQTRLSAIAEINKNIKLEQQNSKQAIKTIYVYVIIAGGVLLILLIIILSYSLYIKKLYTTKTDTPTDKKLSLPYHNDKETEGSLNKMVTNMYWEDVKNNVNILSSDVKLEILDIIKKRINNPEKIALVDSLLILTQFTTDNNAEINHKSNTLINDLSGAMIDDTQQDLLFTQLALMVDTKTRRQGHSFKVAHRAYRIAQSLDDPDLSPSLVHKAALLHDIGFLEILGTVKYEDEITLKRFLEEQRNITDSEPINILKSHPQRGIKLMQYTDIPQQLLDGILYHHEHFDGSGYPFGLAGDDIPLIANVIAAAELVESDEIDNQDAIKDDFKVEVYSKAQLIKPQILNHI